jgi:hypothetical protein
MERREERFEKFRKPRSFVFVSRRGAMQTRAAPIGLFEFVTKNVIAFEQAIYKIALRMFNWSSRSELFAFNRQFGANPIRRQRSTPPMDEHETGYLPVAGKNLERAVRRQPPCETARQTKYQMRLRKLQLHSRFVVDPAPLDVLHGKFFSTPT